ncbi:IS200/IS605 family transposase [Desulfonema ishimotonii]|uniref:IS200/IS605 family transposase n=1 Tax=Desulfonema ishimotonii TaxID=45657 RepID=UPI0022B17A8A|nr:IS200/IS605 family transposase [Desulfonema ishimotonii]
MKGCHSVYCIQFHLVFCVKHRRKVLTRQVSERLKELVTEIAAKSDIRIIGQKTDKDHIHILFASKPAVTLSKFINSLKSVTSRMISNQAEINSFRFLTLPLILMWAWIFLREVISAQCLRQEFPEVKKYLWKDKFWSPSYFLVSAGRITSDDVKKYVENQGRK